MWVQGKEKEKAAEENPAGQPSINGTISAVPADKNHFNIFNPLKSKSHLLPSPGSKYSIQMFLCSARSLRKYDREQEILTFSSSTNVVSLKIHIHAKRTILFHLVNK